MFGFTIKQILEILLILVLIGLLIGAVIYLHIMPGISQLLNISITKVV